MSLILPFSHAIFESQSQHASGAFSNLKKFPAWSIFCRASTFDRVKLRLLNTWDQHVNTMRRRLTGTGVLLRKILGRLLWCLRAHSLRGVRHP